MKRRVFPVIIACFCLSAPAQILTSLEEPKTPDGVYRVEGYFCYHWDESYYKTYYKTYDYITVFYAENEEGAFSCRILAYVLDSSLLAEGQLDRMKDIMTEVGGVSDELGCAKTTHKLFAEYRYCPM